MEGGADSSVANVSHCSRPQLPDASAHFLAESRDVELICYMSLLIVFCPNQCKRKLGYLVI